MIAAAALAAGAITSMAQSNVYSLNIVGYVNKVIPANQFTLLANPLDAGTNDLTTLLPTAPNGTQIQVWNGSGYEGASKSFGSWSTNLTVMPGEGFFVKTPSSITNTFVGTVVVGPGETNSVSLPAGFSLVGSAIPFSGSLTNSGDGTLNLGDSLPNGSQIQAWTGAGYVGASKSFGSWSTNLTISVGQGFFVKPSSAATWNQVLPAN